MSEIPPHNLHIYQKPKQGTGFIQRLQTYNWHHRIAANGWYDAASCDILPRGIALPQRVADQFLGNWVAMYVDNPALPEFEGLINRISFPYGGSTWTISLDEMVNKAQATNPVFSTGDTSGRTVAVDNLTSQSVYGVKHETVDTGILRVSGTTKAANIADTVLAQRAWPKWSIKPGGANSPLIHLDIIGPSQTLKWQERYEASHTTTATLSVVITQATTGIITPLYNGSTFFDNADFGDIVSNGVTSPVWESSGKTSWDALVELGQAGDSGKNYYVVGIGPTDPIRGTRRLYYRPMNANIVYHTRMSDLRVRDTYDRLVKPWRVRPDAGILISDWLIGGAIQGDDPRETYMMVVDYDANSQKVTWTGDDDQTVEGAFQYRRSLKGFRSRNGAPQFRSLST